MYNFTSLHCYDLHACSAEVKGKCEDYLGWLILPKSTLSPILKKRRSSHRHSSSTY